MQKQQEGFKVRKTEKHEKDISRSDTKKTAATSIYSPLEVKSLINLDLISFIIAEEK